MSRRSIKDSLSTREIDFLSAPLVKDSKKITNKVESDPEPLESSSAEASLSSDTKTHPSMQSKKHTLSLLPANRDLQLSKPFSSRLQSRLQNGLRRAALEREERGEPIHTIQDILADAVEKWLMKNEPDALKPSRPADSVG